MSDYNNVSKVFILLDSIKESKTKYIEILDETGEPIFKIKSQLSDKDMVDFMDTFFDNGYKIRQISKQEFDSFEGSETINFNL